MEWTEATQARVAATMGPGPCLDMARRGDVRLVRFVDQIHQLVTSALYNGIDGSQAATGRPIPDAVNALVVQTEAIRLLWRALQFDENYLAHQRAEHKEAMSRGADGYGVD